MGMGICTGLPINLQRKSSCEDGRCMFSRVRGFDLKLEPNAGACRGSGQRVIAPP
jgi:hypothetical protein